MTKTANSVLLAFASLALVVAAVMFAELTPVAHGATQPGITATLATSTNVTVGTTATGNVFATSTCAARIISTSGSAVMITFSDYAAQTPTGSFGHLQPASTTVAYDASMYGCGATKIYSFTTQLITVSETR